MSITSYNLDKELIAKGWAHGIGSNRGKVMNNLLVFLCSPENPDVIVDYHFTVRDPKYWKSTKEHLENIGMLYMMITVSLTEHDTYDIHGPRYEIPQRPPHIRYLVQSI